MRLNGADPRVRAGAPMSPAGLLGGARAARAGLGRRLPATQLRAGSRVRLRPRHEVATCSTSCSPGARRSWRRSRRTWRATSPRGGRRGRSGARPRRAAPARAPLLLFARRRSSRCPAAAPRRATGAPRMLVAGIGNVFLGDDGFGVALAGRLARRALRGASTSSTSGSAAWTSRYAMQDGYDEVVLLDATPRGERAGDAVRDRARPESATRRRSRPTPWTRSRCSALVRRARRHARRTRSSSAASRRRAMSADDGTIVVELSAPVHAALDEAVALVESLLAELTQERRHDGGISTNEPDLHPDGAGTGAGPSWGRSAPASPRCCPSSSGT